MSLSAYGCSFDFKQSSVTYMLYLIYYRSARCYTAINWAIFDGITEDIALQPQMPSETHAVFRTLIFTIFYLILSIFLVITSILAMGESFFLLLFLITNVCYFHTAGLRRCGKSRHLVFWLYFAPFIIIFVAIIVLDLLASGFYIFDYFSTLSVNGLIRILEIRNTDEMRPVLERISISTRSLPAMIIFAAVSKAVLFLIFNIFLIFAFSPAAWQVCTENENIVKVLRKIDRKQKQKSRPVPKSPTVPTVSRRTQQIHLTVTPSVQQVPEQQDDDQQPSSYETQPAFNPYVADEKKQETHF
jgi:hypothetical protein